MQRHRLWQTDTQADASGYWQNIGSLYQSHLNESIVDGSTQRRQGLAPLPLGQSCVKPAPREHQYKMEGWHDWLCL